MSWDQGIAQRLRNLGLRVVEIDGWTTRGSTNFAPQGSVNHHTAGPATGSAPSLNTCIYGRPGVAGPLCNVMQSREPDGNDIAYVIAAGKANHAGEGGWAGLSGNSSVWGLEIEHTGIEPLPQHRLDIAARIHVAMFGGPAGMVCQHFEWAPTRKIDAATEVNPDAFRSSYLLTQLTPTPPTQKRSGSKVHDTTTHPDGNRIDMVGIGPDHRVWHFTGTTLEGFRDGSGDVIPGALARSVSIAWVEDQLVVSMLGFEYPPNGEGITLWTYAHDGTQWGPATPAPGAKFIDPAKV